MSKKPLKKLDREIKTAQDIDAAFEAGVDTTELFDLSKPIRCGGKNWE